MSRDCELGGFGSARYAVFGDDEFAGFGRRIPLRESGRSIQTSDVQPSAFAATARVKAGCLRVLADVLFRFVDFGRCCDETGFPQARYSH